MEVSAQHSACRTIEIFDNLPHLARQAREGSNEEIDGCSLAGSPLGSSMIDIDDARRFLLATLNAESREELAKRFID